MSSESDVSTFLRTHAVQHFLSLKTVSIIQRRYFAESTIAGKSVQPIDSILETLSNVHAANPSQEVFWQSTTIDKLDRLGDHGPLRIFNFSTEPDERDIVQAIWGKLRQFSRPNEHRLQAKLTEIASLTVELWSALRKDSCRVNFSYEPSTESGQEWDFVTYDATGSPKIIGSPTEISVARLPSKSFVLFPRITGFFGSDRHDPKILHRGLALSHDSPAFREGLQEIEHINHATKEFERVLRRRPGSQSSPVTENRQGERSAPSGAVSQKEA